MIDLRKEAIDRLTAKYSRYGATRLQLEKLFTDGQRQGFTLQQIELGIRWGYAHEFKTDEVFTAKDVMQITGETEAEVNARIEALGMEMSQFKGH